MNFLKDLKKLNNNYFAIRHGQSLANVEGIIVSNPAIAINNYGLSEKGKVDVKNSVLKNKILNSQTIIYSSDFLRTKETAEIIRSLLNAKPIILEIKLRERNFGEYDGMSHDYYEKIWSMDKTQPSNFAKGIESVEDVQKRATELIKEIENKLKNKTILLVSHGDVLQILQSSFLSLSPTNHREIPHLNTAEIRELKFTKENHN